MASVKRVLSRESSAVQVQHPQDEMNNSTSKSTPGNRGKNAAASTITNELERGERGGGGGGSGGGGERSADNNHVRSFENVPKGASGRLFLRPLSTESLKGIGDNNIDAVAKFISPEGSFMMNLEAGTASSLLFSSHYPIFSLSHLLITHLLSLLVSSHYSQIHNYNTSSLPITTHNHFLITYLFHYTLHSIHYHYHYHYHYTLFTATITTITTITTAAEVTPASVIPVKPDVKPRILVLLLPLLPLPLHSTH